VSRALASPSGLAVRGRSRPFALLLALSLPVFAIPLGLRAYADALGGRIAAWLSAVVPAPLPVQDEEEGPGPADEFGPPFAGAPALRAVSFAAKQPRQAPRARPAPARGIRISSAQVLALAARRAMPSAVFVKESAQRPAGLLLSGVSALGVGLQDGDVLTEAAGQRVSSVAAVVGIVLAARAHGASEISGRFYRGAVPFSLTVEQPYPKSPLPG